MSHEQRRVLRPEHFTLAPSLLGLPLAAPSRRLAAILIDLLLVAILAHAGGALLLGIAAAWAFFRFAARARILGTAASGGGKRMWVMRAFGAFILFLVVNNAWNELKSAGESLTVSAASTAGPPARPAAAGLRTGVDLASGVVALRRAEDPEEVRAAAGRVVKGMREAGASDADIREALGSAVSGERREWVADLLQELGEAPVPEAVPAESLAVRHAAALVRGDTAAADSLRPLLASALARDSLDELAGRVTELQESTRALQERAENSEKRGLLALIFQTLDELGIGFGWTGLYFTALTTLWKGQTPGKRLMGVRVVRLNGEPMTLWMSFERFGGYAAGLVTGLLGFAQVIWDPNRQGIHDKITETVVVQNVPPPPPAVEPDLRRPRYRAPVQ